MIGTCIDRLTFPLNVAAGLEARGFAAGQPKALVSATSLAIYQEIVHDLKARFATWGLALPDERVDRTG